MAKIIGLDDNPRDSAGKRVTEKVGLEKSTELVCAKCGHNVFIQGAMFRKLSKIYTGQKNDAIIPIEVHLCGECGTIQQDLLPLELKLKPVDD